MQNNRHHIHLICDSNDESLHAWQDTLTILFDEKVRLTRDLFTFSGDAAHYNWKCINHCDFIFVLLGDSYGKLNNTGVSQLHISYLNAKTKNKPMIAFIKHSTNERPRQLVSLIQTIQSQLKTIYFTDKDTDMATLFGSVYEELSLGLEDFRPSRNQTHDTDLLPSSNFKSNAFNSAADSPKTTQPKSDIKISERYGRTQKSEKTAPNLQDDVLLNCSAQAFFGGTLIEVAFIARLTWQQILSALPSNLGFSNDTLARILNELITPQAMPIIKLNHPNIHAVSRCQVVKADLLWVQESLAEAGWISKVQNSTKLKPIWRLTSLAKKIA